MCPSNGPIRRFGDGLHFIGENATRFGEHQSPMRSVKKRETQFTFQLIDLLNDGRGGEVRGLSGLVETAGGSDAQKRGDGSLVNGTHGEFLNRRARLRSV